MSKGASITLKWLNWRILRSREASVLIALLIFCGAIFFTSARSSFYSQLNFLNVLRQMSMLGIFAIGETIVIITGGIDLSLGSLIAFTGMLMAFLVTRVFAHLIDPVAITLGILGTLAASTLIGAFHGTLIHKLKLPAFVVTLATLLLLRSQSLIINDRLQISIANYKWLLFLANGNFFDHTFMPIPVPLVILILVAATAMIALHKMRIGRYLYSIGCNEQASRLSGINVFRVKLFAYCASAVLGGVAGILWASYNAQGDPSIAVGYELDAITADVVGGANLMGGEGSVVGTVFGSLLLYVIFSAINMTLNNPDLWRGTIVGGVLLFAVLVTAFQQRKAQ